MFFWQAGHRGGGGVVTGKDRDWSVSTGPADISRRFIYPAVPFDVSRSSPHELHFTFLLASSANTSFSFPQASHMQDNTDNVLFNSFPGHLSNVLIMFLLFYLCQANTFFV